jgi:transposase
LDVHKDTVVGGAVRRAVRKFKTTTEDLITLSEWLAPRVAPALPWKRPASTGGRSGTFWGDSELELVLANAGHIKNVRGRNTDVKDASWLAHLVAHGLTRGSFVIGP